MRQSRFGRGSNAIGKDGSVVQRGPWPKRHGAESGIDLGFATTVYGQDALGNMIRIDDGQIPGEGSHKPWPTEQ